jgi:hypothetical protein
MAALAVVPGSEWVSREHGVALWGPPGWTAQDPPPFGAAAAFVGPTHDGFAVNMTLIALPLEHEGLYGHAAAQKRNLAAAVGVEDIDRPLELEVAGKTALIVKLRYEQDGLALETWQCHIRRDGRVYTLTLTGPAGAVAQYREEFHGTLASLRFVPSAE